MAKETTLKVKSGLGSLHPQGTCKTCDEIRMKYEAGALQLLYDISLEGEYTSPLTITFKVGKNYDGYKATIYHCKNGTLELYEATVSDGMITIKVDALSPFGIVLTPPGTKALPQTGDGSPLAALLAAGGVFAALIVIAFVKRRASAQE